ncbi:MAG: hypothetical protein HY548_08010, partial [Elusimicrobia bacterium]|nr:hypothetical protein [Elusimicrobiota bacterium]
MTKSPLSVALLFLLAPSFLWAGDAPGLPFLLLQKTARTVGMGGASVALADEPGAVFSNPAGMVFLEKTHVQFGGAGHGDAGFASLAVVLPKAGG